MALSRRVRLHKKIDDWLISAQSQKEAQLNTQIVVALTPLIGLDPQLREVQIKTHTGVSFCGLRIPFRFDPCKAHSR